MTAGHVFTHEAIPGPAAQARLKQRASKNDARYFLRPPQLQGRVLLHSTPTLTSASHAQRFSALPRELSHQRESHRREPPCNNNESCLSTTGACHDAAKEPSRGGLGILFPIWTPTSKTGRGQGELPRVGRYTSSNEGKQRRNEV